MNHYIKPINDANTTDTEYPYWICWNSHFGIGQPLAVIQEGDMKLMVETYCEFHQLQLVEKKP